MKPTILSAAILLALAACSEPERAADGENSPASDPALTTAQSAAPAQSPGAAASAAIPAAMQGRWGLVAADCTSTRGDAKGLLLVEPTGLKFYESVAQLGAVSARSDNTIRAGFAFTGEGMQWTRDMVLELSNDRKTLVRREFGNKAASEPFEYHRCQPRGGA